jgi:hypothetical protein
MQVALLAEMLNLDPWRRYPLMVQVLSSDFSSLFAGVPQSIFHILFIACQYVCAVLPAMSTALMHMWMLRDDMPLHVIGLQVMVPLPQHCFCTVADS